MEVIMENHSVGKTITLLRKARGWTQNELAQKLQVSDKTVSKWEQDNGFPSVEFLPALSNIFNVSIDYILTGKVEEKEIVLMSKMELSAKNDDVELFLSIPDSVIRSKDEIQRYTRKRLGKKAIAVDDRQRPHSPRHTTYWPTRNRETCFGSHRCTILAL